MDNTQRLISGDASVYTGKGKWKNRYCVILRTPIFTTYVRLYLFKDQDDYRRHVAAEVNLENPDEKIYGLTAGNHVDKRNYVIAFTCENSLLLVGLSCFEIMQKWADSINSTLEDANYRVTLEKTSEGSKLPSPLAGHLHIQKSRICFFGESLENPKLFFVWKVATIPEYCVDKERKQFIITADTSCGRGKGKHYFTSHEYDKVYEDMHAVCRANPMPSVQEKRQKFMKNGNVANHLDQVDSSARTAYTNGYIKNHGPNRSDEIDIPKARSARDRPSLSNTQNYCLPNAVHVTSSEDDVFRFDTCEEDVSVFEESHHNYCNLQPGIRDSYIDMAVGSAEDYQQMSSPPHSSTLPKVKKQTPEFKEPGLLGGVFRRSFSMTMRPESRGPIEYIRNLLRSMSQNDVGTGTDVSPNVAESQDSNEDYCEVASTHSPGSNGGLQVIPEHCGAQHTGSRGEPNVCRPGYVRSVSALSSSDDENRFNSILRSKKPRSGGEYVPRERITSVGSDNPVPSPAASPPDNGRHDYINFQPGQSAHDQGVVLRQRSSMSSSITSNHRNTNSQSMLRPYENLHHIKNSHYRVDDEVNNPHLNYMHMDGHLSYSAPTGGGYFPKMIYAQIMFDNESSSPNTRPSMKPPVCVNRSPEPPNTSHVEYAQMDIPRMTSLQEMTKERTSSRGQPQRSGSNLSTNSRSFRGKFKISSRKNEQTGVRS